ncbi:MAG: hypothetical protein K6T30_08040, partial [Alicyclobacillus sp.]|nr:hypothetical protein [Alicyclobacillus sp.]
VWLVRREIPDRPVQVALPAHRIAEHPPDIRRLADLGADVVQIPGTDIAQVCPEGGYTQEEGPAGSAGRPTLAAWARDVESALLWAWASTRSAVVIRPWTKTDLLSGRVSRLEVHTAHLLPLGDLYDTQVRALMRHAGLIQGREGDDRTRRLDEWFLRYVDGGLPALWCSGTPGGRPRTAGERWAQGPECEPRAANEAGKVRQRGTPEVQELEGHGAGWPDRTQLEQGLARCRDCFQLPVIPKVHARTIGLDWHSVIGEPVIEDE